MHTAQVCAFGDACDPLVEASVRGDGEEARKWEEEREKEQQQEKEQEDKEEVVEQESQDDDGVVKKGRGDSQTCSTSILGPSTLSSVLVWSYP